MDKRIGTADNYAISDEVAASQLRYRYEKTPEYLEWLEAVAAWRRCGMDGPQPPAPDLTQGLQEYRDGVPTRRVSVDLWREDTRGLDLRDVPSSTYRATARDRWRLLGAVLPGRDQVAVGPEDLASVMVRFAMLDLGLRGRGEVGDAYHDMVAELYRLALDAAREMVDYLMTADIESALGRREDDA